MATVRNWPRAEVVGKTSLVALALLHLLAFSLIALLPNSLGNGMQILLVLGVVFAETNFAAAWVGLAEPRLRFRLILAAAAMGLAAVALVLFNFRSGELITGLILAASIPVQFLLFLPFLALFRKFTGWRIRTPNSPGEHGSGFGMQFGVRHLLIAMAVTGVLVAISRAAVLGLDWANAMGMVPPMGRVILIMSVILVHNTMAGAPIVIAALVPRWFPAWFLLSVIFTAIVTWLSFLTISNVFPPPSGGMYEFFGLGLGHFAWLMGSLLFLRVLGYRLASR